MSLLREQFGQIDIYLFDQLLRGRITPGMRIFDAGCGGSRNLVYFLKEGYEVFGIDSDRAAVQAVRRLAPAPLSENFRQETIEASSFPSDFADVVLSSAVLHFARDDHHFNAMLRGSWRVLKSGGLFFCRLASSIGIEHQIRRIEGRRFLLPDGSDKLSGGRGTSVSTHSGTGRQTGRSVEDNSGPGTAFHDHLDTPKGLAATLTWVIVPLSAYAEQSKEFLGLRLR